MVLPRKLQLSGRETKLPVILIFTVFLWHSGPMSQTTSTALSPKMVSASQGERVKAVCVQITEELEGLAVTLRRNGSSNELCYIQSGNFTFWSSRCADRINLEYDQQTKEVWVVMETVSIEDSGVYTCSYDKTLPPPVQTLGQSHISLMVSALPIVEISWVPSSSTEKEAILTCTVWDFYPGDIQLSWNKGGQSLTNSTRNDTLSHNSNGTYSCISNLIVSRHDWSESSQFSCQVNHSTLKMPVVKYITLPWFDKATASSDYNLLWSLVVVFGLLAILSAIIWAKPLKLRFKSTSQSSTGRRLPQTTETPPPQESQSDATYTLLTYYPGTLS